MNKRNKGALNKPLKSQLYLQDIDMEEIMESDLKDVEIAAELGMSINQVSKIRRELFED